MPTQPTDLCKYCGKTDWVWGNIMGDFFCNNFICSAISTNFFYSVQYPGKLASLPQAAIGGSTAATNITSKPPLASTSFPIQPTTPCKHCKNISGWTYDSNRNDFYCLMMGCQGFGADMYYKQQYKENSQTDVTKDQLKTLNNLPICSHIPGQTPLQNPSKGNVLFIICKMCGEDLEEFRGKKL